LVFRAPLPMGPSWEPLPLILPIALQCAHPLAADPAKFNRMMADPLIKAACRKMCIEPEELIARPFEDFRKEVEPGWC
jgi:hypothetical protein